MINEQKIIGQMGVNVFLNSLISYKGYDSSNRFFAISIACYAVFWMATFSTNINLLITSLCIAPFLQLSVYRHYRNIKKFKILCHLILVPLILSTISILLDLEIWTLAIFSISTILIYWPFIINLKNNNQESKPYIFGFWEPDLLMSDISRQSRIEPVFGNRIILSELDTKKKKINGHLNTYTLTTNQQNDELNAGEISLNKVNFFKSIINLPLYQFILLVVMVLIPILAMVMFFN